MKSPHSSSAAQPPNHCGNLLALLCTLLRDKSMIVTVPENAGFGRYHGRPFTTLRIMPLSPSPACLTRLPS